MPFRIDGARVAILVVAVLTALALLATGTGQVRAGDNGFDATLDEQAAAPAVAAVSHVKNVSMAAFHSIATGPVARTMEASGFCASATGRDPNFNSWQLVANVELPVGAVVTGINADLYDGDANDITLYLVRSQGNNRSIITTITSSGNAGFSNFASGATSYTVNADEDLWLVYGSSTAGANLNAVCGVQIEYDIPSDHDNLVFTPLASPCSVFDTKTGADWGRRIGKPDGVIAVKVATLSPTEITDQGALACASTAVPSDAVAVAITIIARGPLERGAISMAPSGGVLDVVTSYSDVAQSNNGNEVSVGLTGGSVDIKIGGIAVLAESVNVRAVVNGYYTAPPNNND